MSRLFCETWEPPSLNVHQSLTKSSRLLTVVGCPKAWTVSTVETIYISLRSVATVGNHCLMRMAFVTSFYKYSSAFGADIASWCWGTLLCRSTFIYLVSEPQRETLSTAIQALKLGFVRRLDGGAPTSRKRSEKRGTPMRLNHFWQARFYDFNVWTEKKRIEKLRYIHRNPVTRGLVDSPEKWKWSSFRWYRYGEVGRVKINDTDILVMKVRPPAA
jgi:hypothetical protein